MIRSLKRESPCEPVEGSGGVELMVCVSVGCKMVPNNEWPQAPLDVPIFGLKELEVSEYVL